MKITQVKFSHFKGRTTTQELGDITLVTGRNFHGKTAYLDAIQLALAGHHPKVRKTNQDIFAFATGLEMEVGVEFAGGGGSIARRWFKKGKSVSAEEIFTTVNPGTWQFPTVLLDSSDFFRMSENERVEQVFRACDVDEDALVVDLLRDVAQITVEPLTATARQQIANAKQLVEEADMGRNETGQTVQEFIDGLLDDVKRLKREADADYKKFTSTMSGVRQTTNGQEEQSKDQTAELARLATEQDRLTAELEGHNRALATLAQLVTLEEDFQAAMEQAKEQDRLKAELESCEASLKAMAAHRLESAKLTKAVGDLSTAQAVLEARISGGEHAQEVIEQKLADLAALKCCPTCGAKKQGWKDALRADVEEQLAKAKAALSELRKERGEVVKQLEPAAKALREVNERVDSGRRDEVMEASLRQQLSNAVAARLRAEKIRERMQFTDDMPPQEAIEDAKAETEALLAKVGQDMAQARALQDAYLMQKGRKETTQRSEEQAMEAFAKSTVYSELAKLVGAAREKAVEKAFNSLLDRANKLVEGIMEQPLAYAKGRIGRWLTQAGTVYWVPIDTFSGTEQTLAYAAISIALGADAPCRIVLVDELGRLDEANKVALLKAVKAMVDAGTIEQFVGVDTSATWADGLADKLIKVD